MATFTENYQKLNPAQRQAIDTIEGPVMVVAGPGTGKTQLLSMRVANILRQTDTLPGNILCLTFTESAAAEMRDRLVRMMGPDGHKVAIHTFHSFGTEVINHNPQYFYQGANFRPADELSSFEILEPIFDALPHNSPLGSKMNGTFTALPDTRSAIGHLKKAGLTHDELLKIIDHNEAFIDFAEPILGKVFDVPRLSKKDITNCNEALGKITAFKDSQLPVGIQKSLAQLCHNEFERALDQAESQDSTKPLTAWRNRWLERDAKRHYVFKDRARNKKLRALAHVYQKYLEAMQENELFDFDDMILRVVHALETFDELRYNLQEQFLYVLVDEFQDTNGAQLRLLQNLLNSQVSAGRPNIMVVGDDDQAIYAFQGADLSNILGFRDLYKDPAIITLTDNYRSTGLILEQSRSVITQGEERLENVLENINKALTPHNSGATTSELHQLANPNAEYSWIANHIKQLIKDGAQPNSIAVLGRNHKQLLGLLPFLRDAGIAVNYERRHNILETEHIDALVTFARTIDALAEQRFDIADALLPKLLSFEFWGIKTNEIWKLSLAAHRDHRFWLELMLEDGKKLRAIAELLIIASHQAQHEPLENMLDILLGSTEQQVTESEDTEPGATDPTGPAEEFQSPLRAYYFNAQRLENDPASYLAMLSNLSTLRRRLREYRPDKTLSLHDFVNFIDLHEKTKLPIVDAAEHNVGDQAVYLMTAHKAKGLEFDTVFVMQCQENIWGEHAKRRQSSISFPHNLRLEPAGQTTDDVLRLFFVAMTRAKQHLYMSYYQIDDAGKESPLAAFLLPHASQQHLHPQATAQSAIAALESSWHARHTPPSQADKRELLAPQLSTYQLSSTHLNNFIDVTLGGPQAFFLQNLLRFPQAMGREAIFGSVIHAVLQRAHVHLAHTGERRPTEDILHDFELQLQNARLSENDFTYLHEKGSEVLQTFIAKRHDSFHPKQKVEYKLYGVSLGDARLTGTLDLIEIDEATKTITVTDYKTGKAADSWQGRTDYEKIKLHKYRQQLMMYKLLVERSRDFSGYHVDRALLEFVEADHSGEIRQLEITFDPEELAKFEQLVAAVWQRIMTLDLPDTSQYAPTYKGLQEFENDLLKP